MTEPNRCYYCGQPVAGIEVAPSRAKALTCGYCRDLKALDPWLDPRRSVIYTPRVGEDANSQ